MSDTHPFSPQSWSNIYQALRAKAEGTRGTVTVAGNGAPSATFPHTTADDAFAISIVFDGAVDQHLSRALVELWNKEADLLAGEPEDCAGPYIGNRSFWQLLAIIAIELDRVQAPLPDRSLIDDAMKQFEISHVIADPHVRNAGGPSLVTQFTARTWRSMALRQLDFFYRLRGEVAVEFPIARAFPATRNADVIALVAYWSEQLARLGERASDTYHRLVFSCWREIMEQVERYATHGHPHALYPLNAQFWQSLLLLTTESDACNAPATPWAFQVSSTGDDVRNAAPVDTGPTLDFPAATSWDDAARMQRDAFARLRGEDVITGRLVGRVPRTTVADVRQLAAYWQSGLARIGERHWADISSRHVLERWRAAVAQVDRTPLDADPSSVYANNIDFWEALMTIAIQIAVTAEAPTRWQLVKEATKRAVLDLPNTLRSAAEDLVAAVLKKPLIYAGVGLGGIALILLLRGSGKRESTSATASGNESRP